MNDQLRITLKAAEKLTAALIDSPGNFVRISLKGGACAGITHEMSFDSNVDPEDDIEIHMPGGKVVLDNITASYMKGVTLDWISQGLNQEGFKFSGGAISRSCGCGKSYAYDEKKLYDETEEDKAEV